MTLAAGRVALRKLRAELRDSAAAAAAQAEAGADASESSLVVLASATTTALHLGELLLPVRVSFVCFRGTLSSLLLSCDGKCRLFSVLPRLFVFWFASDIV